MAAEPVKNVILMISDGQGFNTLRATDLYNGAPAVYESGSFLKLGMQTNSANNPAGYNPAQMATNFNYANSGATDSASAATAMYTGVKNNDGVINKSTAGQTLTTFFEHAASAGKSTGAISTVQFSHATPAAVSAHNASRNNYSAIANEMIYDSQLDVIIGAGHPLYNDSGATRATPDYSFVGGQTTWNDITDGNGVNGFAYIDSKTSFADYANNVGGIANSTNKLLGIAQAATTVQQSRSGAPGTGNLNANVPTLADMTKATLNVLDNNTNGFAVMIEGGAVDWANHANQLGRSVEEQNDFNAAVQSVVAYLDAGTSGNDWSNTLLIVTADHDNGHIWGTQNVDGYTLVDGKVQYNVLVDNGQGNLPGAKYFSGGHTNAPVPLFVRGVGAELFQDYVIGNDANLAARYGLAGAEWNGDYVDNTSIFNVATAVGVPEPASLSLLGLGAAAAMRRRQRSR